MFPWFRAAVQGHPWDSCSAWPNKSGRKQSVSSSAQSSGSASATLNFPTAPSSDLSLSSQSCESSSSGTSGGDASVIRATTPPLATSSSADGSQDQPVPSSSVETSCPQPSKTSRPHSAKTSRPSSASQVILPSFFLCLFPIERALSIFNYFLTISFSSFLANGIFVFSEVSSWCSVVAWI